LSKLSLNEYEKIIGGWFLGVTNIFYCGANIYTLGKFYLNNLSLVVSVILISYYCRCLFIKEKNDGAIMETQ
jgi:hypothetical protein